MQKIIVLGQYIFDQTPLHYAAKHGHSSVVEYLINQKADSDAKNKNVRVLFIM